MPYDALYGECRGLAERIAARIQENHTRKFSWVCLPSVRLSEGMYAESRLTIQLMPIQVFGPRIAFAAALVRAREVLLKAFSTALPFAWFSISRETVNAILVIVALVLSFGS